MKKLARLLPIFLFSLILSGCISFLDKRNTAGLQVITNEIPTSIFLDGQYLEKTPYIGKELQPGTYTLEIKPEDTSLAEYETSVTLRKGLLTVVTWKPGARPELSGGVIYELEKLDNKKQIELSVVSIPDGAIVSIDEGPKEFTPYLETEISPGTHDIEISLPSYETQQHTINVVEGHRLNVSVKLAKNPNPNSEEARVETDNSDESEETATESAQQSLEVVPNLSASTSGVRQNALTESATQGTVTIESTGFFQDNQEVLRVRDSGSISGKELGFAKVGQSYPYLGESKGGWHKILFENKEGWVSGAYAELKEN